MTNSTERGRRRLRQSLGKSLAAGITKASISRCGDEASVGLGRASQWSALCLVPLLVLSVATGSQFEDAAAPLFLDVTSEAGLDGALNVFGGISEKRYILESTGSGVAFFDYDNDGYLDIFLVNGTTLKGSPSGTTPTNQLFRNLGDGTFVDVTEEAGLRRTGWGQGVCVGDFNNDGHDDLFVTYYGQNVLYRNNGDGTFTDVTAAAGLAGKGTRWGAGCAFLDYDRDGHLDLFVANYVDFDLESAPIPESRRDSCNWKGIPVFCGPRGLRGEQNLLYRNNGDGTFTEVSEEAGIVVPNGTYYGLGVVVSDFDNDGWPDIYVACDSTANLLFLNNANGTFVESALMAGAAFNEDGREQAGMGVAVGDYSRNGFFDLVVTNFSDDTSTLYHNLGNGHFSDRTRVSRLAVNTRFLGWGAVFFDFGNNGWKDIFLANGHVYPEVDDHGMDTSYRQRNLLYRNNGDLTFSDISLEAGPTLLQEKSSRGLAYGDFDNDGKVDLLINNMNDVPTLLRNVSPGEDHWLMVKTVGTSSNRSGIGARINIEYDGERQTEEIRSGGSWGSQNDLRAHFGLGGASQVERLEIRWPSGHLDRLEDVPANQILTVREGDHPPEDARPAKNKSR